jgi:hypothetical protein
LYIIYYYCYYLNDSSIMILHWCLSLFQRELNSITNFVHRHFVYLLGVSPSASKMIFHLQWQASCNTYKTGSGILRDLAHQTACSLMFTALALKWKHWNANKWNSTTSSFNMTWQSLVERMENSTCRPPTNKLNFYTYSHVRGLSN